MQREHPFGATHDFAGYLNITSKGSAAAEIEGNYLFFLFGLEFVVKIEPIQKSLTSIFLQKPTFVRLLLP